MSGDRENLIKNNFLRLSSITDDVQIKISSKLHQGFENIIGEGFFGFSSSLKKL
jgi:hypothetical protein